MADGRDNMGVRTEPHIGSGRVTTQNACPEYLNLRDARVAAAGTQSKSRQRQWRPALSGASARVRPRKSGNAHRFASRSSWGGNVSMRNDISIAVLGPLSRGQAPVARFCRGYLLPL